MSEARKRTRTSQVSVYFIQSEGDLGPIKIGLAVDVKKRMEMFRTGNAGELRLLWSMECDTREQARVMESSFHALFDDLRIGHSEWFRWSQDIIDLIDGLRKIHRSFNGASVVVNFNIRRMAVGGIRFEPRRP